METDGWDYDAFCKRCKHYNDSLSFRWFFILFDQSYCKFFYKSISKFNRIIGILLTLCALVWGLVIGVVYLLPILINQLTSLIATSQTIYSRLQDLIIDLSTYPAFQNLDIQATIQQLNLSYVDILQNILNSVTNSVGSVLSALFSTVLIIIMTPVFLIYFLLDGHKFLPMLERTVLKRDKLHITGLLKKFECYNRSIY